MLTIFDNDGTLCDSQSVESDCYAEAIFRVTGRRLSSVDWTTYDEPTSSAIVRDFLAGEPDAPTLESEIERTYLRLMEEARPSTPDEFCPLPGAREFIARLRADARFTVAIATGCFASTARFKLRCCGLDLDTFPHATSSDTPRRRDILPLAAARAGRTLGEAVYFGDAPWDVIVSRRLGVRMIGIGRRHEELRALGVSHVFRDYTDPDAIFRVLLDASAP